MKAGTVREQARDIPVAAEVDVLVVGAGPAGVGAAVTAAREGAATMLIEKSSMFGGAWTSMMQTHATCFTDGEKVVVGGLAREIIGRLHALGMAEDPAEKVRLHPTSVTAVFDHEWMKCILDDMVTEAGVRPLLHTFCVGALVEGGVVRGVIVESKSGRQAIRATVTVDCSGDADVAHFAGAPTRKGRDKDGKCQPVNTTFLLSGVDFQRAVEWHTADRSRLGALCDEARRNGELEGEFEVRRLGAATLFPDVTYHNMGHVFDVDPTSAADLTRAEIEGRRQVRQIYRFFREHVPGHESCRLAAIAPCVGLRESRRIIGEYELAAADVLESRRFDDGIAVHNYRLDVHSAAGLAAEPGIDVQAGPAKGTVYEVPYRCLVPRGVEQLLAAGRCISADRAALGSARTTVCCVQLGEAAGLAAAGAARRGARVRDIDGAQLKKRLQSMRVQPARSGTHPRARAD